MPHTGGSSASRPPAASKAAPCQAWRSCGPRPPRPLSACAALMPWAQRAGCQAPSSAAATPSAPNTSAAGGAPVQRGRATGKVAAAQITTQKIQGRGRQRRAQSHAQAAAHQAQHARFQQHQLLALGRGEPQHAQQRPLRRAPAHAQGQHREHQKSAGEQRHQCQHRQVDAVSPRQRAQAVACLAGLGKPCACLASRVLPSGFG